MAEQVHNNRNEFTFRRWTPASSKSDNEKVEVDDDEYMREVNPEN